MGRKIPANGMSMPSALTKTLMFIVILGLSMAAVSCVSTKLVYDDSLPPDQTTVVVLSAELTIKAYNGISVDWHDNNALELTLPAGETEFRGDAYSRSVSATSTSVSRVRDFTFRYNFEAGKRYRLMLGAGAGGLAVFDEGTFEKPISWMAAYKTGQIVPFVREEILLK
jgi:hypothetical protein